MDNKRIIPFGYRISCGQIQVHNEQAEIVQSIFQDYLAGETVLSITQKLNLSNHQYKSNSKWNKNIVYRILSDARYIGEADYPHIIDKTVFEMISSRRQTNATGKLNPAIRVFRDKIVCQKCSAPMIRFANIRQGNAVVWSCNGCGIRTCGIPDAELIDRMETAVQAITDSPSSAMKEVPIENSYPLSLVKAERNLERELNNTASDEKRLLQLIQDIAGIQYRYCKSGTIEADNQYLLMLINQHNIGAISHTELIQQAIQSIELSASGHISVRLINNKIL